jgi:hypothetical protein
MGGSYFTFGDGPLCNSPPKYSAVPGPVSLLMACCGARCGELCTGGGSGG